MQDTMISISTGFHLPMHLIESFELPTSIYLEYELTSLISTKVQNEATVCSRLSFHSPNDSSYQITGP